LTVCEKVLCGMDRADPARRRSNMTQHADTGAGTVSPRRVLGPLAVAQFICSFAGSNMNVMINDISTDLDTTVQGVQVAITIFLLVMAALMIPGGKLTDRYGRKRCFIAGLPLEGDGIGPAGGPLLGGLITSAISWRAAFIFQALIIATIIVLSRRIRDPLPP